MVDPVPAHLRTVTPALVCTPCTDAVTWYERAFGAEEIGPRLDTPDGRVAHTEIRIGDSVVMLGDEWPDAPVRSPHALGGSTATLFLHVDDVDTWWERALDAGAEIVYPLAVQFYGDKAGRVRNPFGHTWALAQHVEDVSAEEMARRMAAMGDDA
jgi:PhnB protein